MLATLIDARGPKQHLLLREARRRNGTLERRLALGQRAGFVDDQGVDFAQLFYRGSIPEQYALGRGLARCNHDGHGCGETERTGAGDDQHRHGVDESVDPARLRPEQTPYQKGGQRDEHDHDHEVARDSIGHALQWCLRPLRLRHHLHNLRQHGAGADRLCAHRQCPGGIHRRANQTITRPLGDRHGLPGEHGLVDGAAAVVNDTVHRDLFAWSHP